MSSVLSVSVPGSVGGKSSGDSYCSCCSCSFSAVVGGKSSGDCCCSCCSCSFSAVVGCSASSLSANRSASTARSINVSIVDQTVIIEITGSFVDQNYRNC